MRKPITKTVALLTTGDELLNGEITNSNGQYIGQQLCQHHIENGLHMTCGDKAQALENAIVFLLHHHDALIITGGLGPTSDDRTRFALANATKQALHFNYQVWQAIVKRLATHHTHITNNNKQQALFPKHAHIIDNPNGSAAACKLHYQNKLIFMLPGPPHECLPIFDNHIIPSLLTHGFALKKYYQKWQLTGISESLLAATLDPLLKDYDITLGYRVIKPYIELKLLATQRPTLLATVAIIAPLITPYLAK